MSIAPRPQRHLFEVSGGAPFTVSGVRLLQPGVAVLQSVGVDDGGDVIQKLVGHEALTVQLWEIRKQYSLVINLGTMSRGVPILSIYLVEE